LDDEELWTRLFRPRNMSSLVSNPIPHQQQQVYPEISTHYSTWTAETPVQDPPSTKTPGFMSMFIAWETPCFMFARDLVCVELSTTAVKLFTATGIWYRVMANSSPREHRQKVEPLAKICWRPNWVSGPSAYLRCYSFWYSFAKASDRWRTTWRRCRLDCLIILTTTRCLTILPPRLKSMQRTPPWTRWKSSAHVLRPVAPSRFAKQELTSLGFEPRPLVS